MMKLSARVPEDAWRVKGASLLKLPGGSIQGI